LAERGENGKRLPLPGGLEVRREHDTLIFRAGRGVARTKGGEARNFERVVNLDGKSTAIRIEELGCVFRFRVIDWPVDRGQTIETGSVLDLDVLRSPLMLRNWRAGDRLRPAGHRGAHKLKRLLSKKGVSGMEREGWPVLTSGGAVAWARGFPVAAEFAVRSGTRAGVVIAEEAIS
jgi:tRNA(Ile)-lysidine synthase